MGDIILEKSVITPKGEVLVFGPASSDIIAGLDMDRGLRAFRPPEPQKRALQMIAEPGVGRVYLATTGNTILGYVTFHEPEPDSRFMQRGLKFVIELGAIEVATSWRKYGLGKNLLKVAYRDDFFEDFIVISSHYSWHWDLEGAGLSMIDYKKMLSKLMQTGGMEKRGTDDPEIISHPANFMKARIGKRITPEQVVAFESCLYKHMWMI